MEKELTTNNLVFFIDNSKEDIDLLKQCISNYLQKNDFNYRVEFDEFVYDGKIERNEVANNVITTIKSKKDIENISLVIDLSLTQQEETHAFINKASVDERSGYLLGEDICKKIKECNLTNHISYIFVSFWLEEFKPKIENSFFASKPITGIDGEGNRALYSENRLASNYLYRDILNENERSYIRAFSKMVLLPFKARNGEQ